MCVILMLEGVDAQTVKLTYDDEVITIFRTG
jgi:hypothetical protein